MSTQIVKVRKSNHGVEYSLSTIDCYFGINGAGESDGAIKGERALTHTFLMDTLRKVMGATLTIIDASIHEEKQNKAIKDLIRRVISDEMEFSAEWAFDQKEVQKLVNVISEEEFDELRPVGIEDALGVE